MRNFFYCIILSLFFITACQKPNNGLSWNTHVSIPLLQSELGVDDIFPDSILQDNPDQSYSLILDIPITGFQNENIIQVHDTLSKDEMQISIGVNLPPGFNVFNQVNNFNMDLEDVKLTEARARTAQLKFLVSSTVPSPLVVQYDVLSSDLNGQFYTITDQVPQGSVDTPATMVKEISLANYTMNFTGENHNTYNNVRTQTQLWLPQDGDNVWIYPSDKVEIISIFDKLEIDYAKGYFGQSTQTVVDSSNIGTFDNFHSGIFNLDQVTSQLEINNYIGADFRLKINEISATNFDQQQTVVLQDPIIGGFINLLRAEDGGVTSQPKPFKYVYKLQNSNLIDLINLQADQLKFDMDYYINPLGNISGDQDFIYADYGLEGNIHIDIPLNISTKNLVIQQESDFNLSDKNKIENGNLNLLIDNYFPMDADVQFYLLDENLIIVDSLIKSPQSVLAGISQQAGYITEAQRTQLSIPLNSSTLTKLRNHPRILTRVKLNTLGQNKWQFYEHYRMKIKIILEGDYAV